MQKQPLKKSCMITKYFNFSNNCCLHSSIKTYQFKSCMGSTSVLRKEITNKQMSKIKYDLFSLRVNVLPFLFFCFDLSQDCRTGCSATITFTALRNLHFLTPPCSVCISVCLLSFPFAYFCLNITSPEGI